MMILVLAYTSGLAAPVVWVESPLKTIHQTDSEGTNASFQMYAARGETESFQIGIRASSQSLGNVSVTATDLSGPGGHAIASSAISLFREHYVYVSPASPNWGGSNQPIGAGWYPDALIPFTNPETGQALSGASLVAVPFSLAAGNNDPIWVDVAVPRDAVAGTYTGSFTVTSSQGNATVNLSLTVWDFALPVKPALKSTFLVWTAGSKATYKELMRHRLMPGSVSTGDERELIDTMGLSCVNLGFWSGADAGNQTMSAAPSTAQFQSAKNTHQSDLFLYNYTADEIGGATSLYEPMKEWARNMHAAGINNLVTMSPISELYDDGSGTGRSAVDIWVVLPVMYDAATSRINYVRGKGDEVWSYNCLVQDAYSPKWLIDFAPINFRIQPGFISQSLGLSGLLYWRVDRWKTNQWNNVNNTGDFSSANYPGDGMLVYPGTDVGLSGSVVASMRMKHLRDGADDYDYIQILKGLGRGDWALSVVHTVGPDWSNWTRDIAALESARRQLGDEINRLSTSTNPPPVAAFAAAPTNGYVPLRTVFTDSSTGTITNRHWVFGDGNTFDTVSQVSVTNLYTNVGAYTVSLTVSGPEGSSTNTQAGLIGVLVVPVPKFGATNRLAMSVAGGALTFNVECVDGLQYRLVCKDNLMSTGTPWAAVTPPSTDGWTNGFNGIITIQDPGSTGATQRFYRLESKSISAP